MDVDQIVSRPYSCVCEESTSAGIVPAAEALMGRYRAREDCVLVRAGYLDLVGNTWCFTVCGDGWADVCVVRGAQGQETSVRVVHLCAGDLVADEGGADGG